MKNLYIELKEKCTCQDPEHTKYWPENTSCRYCVNGFVSVFVPIDELYKANERLEHENARLKAELEFAQSGIEDCKKENENLKKAIVTCIDRPKGVVPDIVCEIMTESEMEKIREDE